MALLDVMWGDETFEKASCKVGVWLMPSEGFPAIDKEMHIYTAMNKDGIPVRPQGRQEKVSARADGYRDELGTWKRAIVDADEGVMLKIFMRNNKGYGCPTIIASQVVRVRAEAAYNEIQIDLTGDRRARYQKVYVKGNFDILTLEQAKERGIVVPPTFESTYSTDNVRKLVTVVQKEAERSPMVTPRIKEVVNEAGEVKRIRVVKRSRAIDV